MACVQNDPSSVLETAVIKMYGQRSSTITSLINAV